MASALSIDLPVTYNGKVGLPLERFENLREYKHVAHDALSRGLQKPPIMTNPMYADDISAEVDYNLSGLQNQETILKGIKNPDQYETETTGQAYRRLWLEVLNNVPSESEQMVWEYSGLTFDPRLGKIVTDDPGNMFSTESEDMSTKLQKSFMAFHKERRSDPSFNPLELYSKEFQKTLGQRGQAFKGAGEIFATMHSLASLLPEGEAATFIRDATAAAAGIATGATTINEFRQWMAKLYREASSHVGASASRASAGSF